MACMHNVWMIKIMKEDLWKVEKVIVYWRHGVLQLRKTAQLYQAAYDFEQWFCSVWNLKKKKKIKSSLLDNEFAGVSSRHIGPVSISR